MLHELFLALSGHDSPLLNDNKRDELLSTVISPSETALLKSIANLGTLHADIRSRAFSISSSYSSVICCAITSAVISRHLEAFKQAILNVEKSILQHDAHVVGAYDIVPISGLARAFDGWRRTLEWLQNLMLLIQVGPEIRTTQAARIGTDARVIDWLRKESQTGYPDLEKVALELVQTAESAWIRQVSTWLLYGRLPTSGGKDFFIQPDSSLPTGHTEYALVLGLAPSFVSHSTASSILFIGKSLNHIQDKGLGASSSGVDSSGRSLLSVHLELLSSLQYPIDPSNLSRTIGAIRSSLAQNVLQKLLPLSSILQILCVLQDFFLLRRGEFAMAVVNAADECLSGRHLRAAADPRHKDSHRLGGIMIKEGEVITVLNRAWATLVSLQGIDVNEEEDEALDLARGMIHLSIKKSTAGGHVACASNKLYPIEPIFENVLLATPTTLSIDVPSPIDLFLAPAETNAYSLVNAYLISLRRAHAHLSGLWRLTPLRRVLPSPRHTRDTQDQGSVRNARLPSIPRQRYMRAIWATLAFTTSFLTELITYLEGEVIAGSWTAFHEWLDPLASRPFSAASPSIANMKSPSDRSASHHDPQILTLAHRVYMSALLPALLLTDPTFPGLLRTLIANCDHIVPLMQRLAAVQQALVATKRSDNDLINDGDNAVWKNLTDEEMETFHELGEARKRVLDTSTLLRNRLKELGGEKSAGSAGNNVSRKARGFRTNEDEETGFVPWDESGGLDRLLMRLESGSDMLTLHSFQ